MKRKPEIIILWVPPGLRVWVLELAKNWGYVEKPAQISELGEEK